MSNPTSGRFGVLSYTDHNCPVCYNFVRIGARHWCPDTSLSGSALCICGTCHAPFRREYGHSCHCPIVNIAWHQNPNGTITFGPLADYPTPTIWGANPIPIQGVVIPPDPSKKDRLQRQIARLREIFINDFIPELNEVLAVLDDLALDL